MFLHGFGVVYGHGGIEIVDLPAHGTCNGGPVAGKVDYQFISQE